MTTRVLTAWRELRERASQKPPLLDRLAGAAARRPVMVRGVNVPLLVVRCVMRIIDVRVTGLAAEMTYYALISILPLVTAFGAALGSLERLIGREGVERIETALVDRVSDVFDEAVTTDVLTPLIDSLLSRERAGVAIGGTLVALWLASRMFRAAIRALDDAYTVSQRRGLVQQTVLGLAMALGAVLTLVVLLGMLVIGPLLGGGREVAELIGLGEAFSGAWTLLRWPAVVTVAGGYLLMLYRFGPEVDNNWRQCLPGAVVGTAGLLAVAFAFQLYLASVGPSGPEVGAAGESVAIAAETLGAILAAVLWLWLSSTVILSGGVLNAELQRLRSDDAPRGAGTSSALCADPSTLSR